MQLELSLPDSLPDWQTCKHSGWYSTAEVPGGFYCDRCKRLISRSVVLSDEPTQLGYVTADWAWYYRDGKPWTADDGEVRR